MQETRIVIICGPTASGKSMLAMHIAEERGGVIINADSQQMYRELRILTSRPSPEDEARVLHRLYGTLPAEMPCSAGIWLELARAEIDRALAQGMTPVVVGGTGLYLSALINGISPIPDVQEGARVEAEEMLRALGHAAFHARLAEVDPLLATRLKVGDSQRLTRAYSVWLSTGKALSEWYNEKLLSFYNKQLFEIIKAIPERKTLYDNCDSRFDSMMKSGAVEEVSELLALHIPSHLPAMKTIGVREIGDYLAGRISLEKAVDLAKRKTRNYAKRQLTWFRHQMPD